MEIKLSEIIKDEANSLFNLEVGYVDPKDFDAVYESITGDFRLGAICMASKIKDLFDYLEMKNDPNAKKVTDLLKNFIENEVKEIHRGRKYL